MSVRRFLVTSSLGSRMDVWAATATYANWIEGRGPEERETWLVTCFGEHADDFLARCQWCFKRNRTASEYEQKNLKGVWHRLCVRCANTRLRNPYNALLPMRKIGSEENGGSGA